MLRLADEYQPTITSQWPAYWTEMRGIAHGAGVSVRDIIAINVRTEIAFGLFSDGCTALAWRRGDGGASWLAQNWDWSPRQQENLILLTMERAGKPTIKIVTEAGIIGKIGLNSAGVGVCLNAIRAKGMDATRLPCHLGLRVVLESNSRQEAVSELEKWGIASACHMLVADETGGIGLEWSAVGLQKLLPDARQRIFHTNHYLREHIGVKDLNWLEDSHFRVARIQELSDHIHGEPDRDSVWGLLKDEMNWPGSICRSAQDGSTSATLFTIVMDLKARKADVTLGRPLEPVEQFQLEFGTFESC